MDTRENGTEVLSLSMLICGQSTKRPLISTFWIICSARTCKKPAIDRGMDAINFECSARYFSSLWVMGSWIDDLISFDGVQFLGRQYGCVPGFLSCLTYSCISAFNSIQVHAVIHTQQNPRFSVPISYQTQVPITDIWLTDAAPHNTIKPYLTLIVTISFLPLNLFIHQQHQSAFLVITISDLVISSFVPRSESCRKLVYLFCSDIYFQYFTCCTWMKLPRWQCYIMVAVAVT